MPTLDKRISELDAAGSLDPSDVFALVNSGETRKVTLDDLATAVKDLISADIVAAAQAAIVPIDPVTGLSVSFTTVPFLAANYAGLGGMTWTLDASDQAEYAYFRLKDAVFFTLTVNSSSCSGGNANLKVKLPNSWTAARATEGIGYALQSAAGVNEFVRCFTDPSFDATQIFLKRNTGTFGASTNDTFIRFQLWIALA